MEIPVTIQIDRPPSVVWDFLVDHDKMRQWMTGLQSVAQVSPGANGVGSVHRMAIEERGKLAMYEAVNTVFEPHRQIAIDLSGGNMGTLTMHIDYKLVDLNGATRLSYLASCQFSGWQVLFAPLFKLFGASQAKKYLGNLKRTVEAA